MAHPTASCGPPTTPAAPSSSWTAATGTSRPVGRPRRRPPPRPGQRRRRGDQLRRRDDAGRPVFDQPTAEIYHAVADTRFPYRIYGAQQDNSTISIPSRSDRGPISEEDWFDVAAARAAYRRASRQPRHRLCRRPPGGVITRYDHASAPIRDISPWPSRWPAAQPDALALPLQLVAPAMPSRRTTRGILYPAGNVSSAPTDEGASWQVISPDLTRNDTPTLMASGGLSGADECRPTTRTTTTAPSPASPSRPRGRACCGPARTTAASRSTDGGATWRDVTPPSCPSGPISSLSLAPRRGGGLLAATRHKLDDFRPYLYKTDDDGAHWQEISGIPADQFVRLVRADPTRRGVLYAGSEAGVYYSLDDGGAWRPLQGNCPPSPSTTCWSRTATSSRRPTGAACGSWTTSPRLHGLGRRRRPQAALHLFAPRPAYRVIRQITGSHRYIAMGYPSAASEPSRRRHHLVLPVRAAGHSPYP